MAWMRASGFHFTRSATFAPAMAPIASTISLTLAVMPGRLTTRLLPQLADGRSCARMKFCTTLPGDNSHTPVS